MSISWLRFDVVEDTKRIVKAQIHTKKKRGVLDVLQPVKTPWNKNVAMGSISQKITFHYWF